MNNTSTATQPYSLTVNEAVNYSGLKRTRIYELLAERKITARKAGRRTMIDAASLRSFLDGLPAYESAA